MKKFRLLLVFMTLLLSVRAEAIFDSFAIFYGKKNNEIHQIILRSLDTREKKWKLTRAPHDDKDGGISSEYRENNNNKSYLIFSTFDGGKKQIFRTGTELFMRYKEKAEKFPGTWVNNYANGRTEKTKSFVSIKMVSSDEQTICFEQYISEQDITDDENPGDVKIRQGKDQDHSINLIVDLGDGRLHWYVYGAQKRLIPPEEKAYIIELFKYMEAQIKNVA